MGDPAESASLRLWVLEHRLAVCRGPLEFGLTGVLASLEVPLAESKVGILAIARSQLDLAAQTLRERGHEVHEP
ncbi:MAG TPA: hypothetical protein VFT03_03020 [Rubrobacteraceae bacterium]|nr:hypothetical protein [Rubrobacteraceae bacterium]